MSKKGKIKPPPPVKTADVIRPPKLPTGKTISFSFEHFCGGHDTCKKENFHIYYPRVFCEKLREIGELTRIQFQTTISDLHYRIHPIDWDDPRVQYAGFGLNPEFDHDAWQFSVSTGKYGRVCGFFIEDIFHVVWLDPKHKVYPRDN